MRIHAFVVSALLKGKKTKEIWDLGEHEIAAKVQIALSRKQWRTVDAVAKEAAQESIPVEAYNAAILRAGITPFDADGQQRIYADIRTGKAWELHKAILERHGLLKDRIP